MGVAQVSAPLRVVIVEDSEDDARLIVRELRRGGYDNVTAQRVDTPRELTALLDNGEWDLVISDHNLPQFSAPEALGIVRARVPDLPFIIVSGSIGEELAVAAMKAGASDFLVKGQLARLAPAVGRELNEVARRRKHAEAEEALRRAEDQLRQAQKVEAIGQLAGGVAHDFNNLLTAILGYSELLLDEMPCDTVSRGRLEEIQKAGERAASLTRQLLAFSRQQVLEPRVVNLNDIIADVSKLLGRLIGADIDLSTELTSDLGRVKVDPGQMEQVLMNLAVNARDAMPQGGRLTIRTSQKTFTQPHQVQTIAMQAGDYVVVSISDTGTGMTPEIVGRIFEPFFTTKEAGRGTGLGLSTVYGIVKQSGGYIWVDSELGRGTTFDVFLPRVDAPLEAKAKSGATAPATIDGSETILLVDDEEPIRSLICKALEPHGYHVLTAADGVDAMAVADAYRGRIHLLITDLVMPRLGGSQLAERLSAVRRDLVVLYLSGYTDRREWNLESSRSGRAYLQKPFTPSGLRRKVRELLDSTSARPA